MDGDRANSDSLAKLHGRDVRHVAPSEPSVAVPPCPVCGNGWARPTYVIGGHVFRLVTCDECGLGRLHPQPPAQTVEGFYPPEYYGDSRNKFSGPVEFVMRRLAARRARWLVHDIPRGGRVLDVGCGRGLLLNAFLERGLETHGVEASRNAVQGADPRAEIAIAPRLADVGYASGYFDAVVLSHVLEHLPDPRGTLEEIHRVLRPGGKLFVAIPNFSSWQARWAGPAWLHLDLPRHFFHFPLSSLSRLLVDCGFRCELERHFSLTQNTFGWLQSALNRFGWLPRNGLYTLLHRRDPGNPPPYDRLTRLLFRLAWVCGMPVALVVSIAAAAARSGATVQVAARCEPNRGDEKPQHTSPSVADANSSD